MSFRYDGRKGLKLSDLSTTDDLFFNRAGLDRSRTEKIVNDALQKADDGELFLERSQNESFLFDDRKLKQSSFSSKAVSYTHLTLPTNREV